jgi:hypothetical protein
MGHIKEPKGIDFVVDPTPLTVEDIKKISDIIAHYKSTGQKMPLSKTMRELRYSKTIKKKEIAKCKTLEKKTIILLTTGIFDGLFVVWESLYIQLNLSTVCNWF